MYKSHSSALCLLLLLTAFHQSASAQTIDDFGQWSALFSQDRFSPDSRLRWWFDGHFRLFDDSDGFGQSIIRPGIGLDVGENSALWAGYGWIRTSPIHADDVDEHRIWQQWTWSQECQAMKFALRSRLEQRIIELGSDTGLRFRQLVRGQRALRGCPRLTFVVWDELFINMNDTDWGARSGFDQNRLFVGFGYKRFSSSKWRTEIGYLNQAVNNVGPTNRSNHILSVNFFR